MDDPEVPEVPEMSEVPEVPEELSEPVVIKKRGRPKGSLNKKTIEKMTVEKEPSPVDSKDLVLDVDFTSDEVLGYTDTPRTPKRKPKKPKVPPPPIESEEDESPPPPPPPPPPKSKRERKPRVEVEPLNPPSYLEILTRGLKEQRAKQYAEQVAQYDRFFQW